MGITNLGAVSMSAGGVYNPETVYKKYKVVSANGGSYMYINLTPAAGVSVTDTSHWQQIAEKGETGDTGAAGYTPVRGTDYWTADDITTMESYLNNYVNTVILGGAS